MSKRMFLSESHWVSLSGLIRIIAVGLILLTTMCGGITTAQTPNNRDSVNVTPDEVIQLQERALTLRKELDSLSKKDGVEVSTTTFQSINDHLAQGNASYRAANYGEAKQHYVDATSQAEATLSQAYLDRTDFLLTASRTHLRELRASGYSTHEMAVLAERIDQLETRRAAASDLQDARDVHDDTESLSEDDQTLPSTDLVSTVKLLRSGLFVVPLGVVALVAGVVGIGVDRRWGRSSETETETETETTARVVENASEQEQEQEQEERL